MSIATECGLACGLPYCHHEGGGPAQIHLTGRTAATNRAATQFEGAHARSAQGYSVAKPDLGSKRQCQNCGTKFFDLNKDPILCPKCGTTFLVAAAAPPTRAARAAPAKDEEENEPEGEAEVVSLEDADQVEDGKVEAAATDDEDVEDDDASNDDDNAFLEDEEDDDDDVAGLIDGDIEDDEER